MLSSKLTDEMRYLVPGMIQCIRAYIIQHKESLIEYLPTFIDIFINVLNQKLYDLAFPLLNTIITTFSYVSIQSYIPKVFNTILSYHQYDKTIDFSHGLIIFLSLFINMYGFGRLKKLTDQVQVGILISLVGEEVKNINIIEEPQQRKEVALALCKIVLGIENITQELFRDIVESLIDLINSRKSIFITKDINEKENYQQLQSTLINVLYKYKLGYIYRR